MSRTFFSIAEFESRHEKVRAAMDDLGIELLLVLAPSHVNYLIGTPAKRSWTARSHSTPQDESGAFRRRSPARSGTAAVE